jgi:hypothetical protein
MKPRQVQLIRNRQMKEGQQVPDVRDFFEFLVNHVQTRKNAEEVLWNPHKLKMAYQIAHPNHVGYSSWVNVITPGRPPPAGMQFTVDQILRKAFPARIPKMVVSECNAVDKRLRAARRFQTKDLCKFIVDWIRTNKQNYQYPSDDASEVFIELETGANAKWPGNPFKLFLKIPKSAVREVLRPLFWTSAVESPLHNQSTRMRRPSSQSEKKSLKMASCHQLQPVPGWTGVQFWSMTRES